MAKPSYAVGQYTGNTAAINIELGFVPSRVDIHNWTDANVRFVATRNSATGAWKTTQVASNGAQTDVSANGVTTYAGVAGVGTDAKRAGITVGTSLSTDAKVFTYIAFR